METAGAFFGFDDPPDGGEDSFFTDLADDDAGAFFAGIEGELESALDVDLGAAPDSAETFFSDLAPEPPAVTAVVIEAPIDRTRTRPTTPAAKVMHEDLIIDVQPVARAQKRRKKTPRPKVKSTAVYAEEAKPDPEVPEWRKERARRRAEKKALKKAARQARKVADKAKALGEEIKTETERAKAKTRKPRAEKMLAAAGSDIEVSELIIEVPALELDVAQPEARPRDQRRRRRPNVVKVDREVPIITIDDDAKTDNNGWIGFAITIGAMILLYWCG